MLLAKLAITATRAGIVEATYSGVGWAISFRDKRSGQTVCSNRALGGAFGFFYRYHPREIKQLCKGRLEGDVRIHRSVIERFRHLIITEDIIGNKKRV